MRIYVEFGNFFFNVLQRYQVTLTYKLKANKVNKKPILCSESKTVEL